MKKNGISTILLLIFCAALLVLSACGGNSAPKPTEAIVLPESAAPQAPADSAAQPTPEAPAASETPTDNASAPADDSYFDDVVFVGDSVSVKLELFVNKMRESDPTYLGKAKFLVSGSLGSTNALWEIDEKSVHPKIDDKKVLVEDGIATLGAKKVYIMLGLNDIVVSGIDGSIENMGKLTDKITEKSPGIKIFIQSATPITRGGEKTKLNNKALAEYDKKLQQFCKDKGYAFIDVASVLRDKEGYLPDNYSSDNYVHLTDKACQIWIDYLRTHTK